MSAAGGLGRPGIFLGLGSACGVASRVLIGWVSDLIRSGWLTVVATLMLLGGIGLVSLAYLERPALLAVCVVLGFAAGWGHNGLVLYAVVRLHPCAPAAATGVTQLGSFVGPVIGPPVFGLVASTWSHRAGWLLLAATSMIASVLVVIGHPAITQRRPHGTTFIVSPETNQLVAHAGATPLRKRRPEPARAHGRRPARIAPPSTLRLAS